MQLRTLISQKQRDGIWIASLILVCLSIFVQLGLAYLLIIVGKGDIQKPHKQPKLERYNNLVLFVTLLISVINVIINGFMSTTSTNSYLDTPSIELLAKNKT
jgi:heme/copper-type cytochrome/quinol oxidase subunit 2